MEADDGFLLPQNSQSLALSYDPSKIVIACVLLYWLTFKQNFIKKWMIKWICIQGVYIAYQNFQDWLMQEGSCVICI